MKKLLISVLFSLISAFGIFAFAACSGTPQGGPPAQVSVTVTEEEWKSALSAVSGGGDSIDCKFHNKAVFYGDEYLTDIRFVYDKPNGVAKYVYASEDLNYELYCWRGSGDKYYVMGVEGTGLFKQEVGKGEFDKVIKNYLEATVTGDGVIYDLQDKFGEFVFDEEDGEYKGNLQLYDLPFRFALKFADGKLVKFDIVQGEISMNMEYSYNDILVTVPEDILDMPIVGQ